MKIDPAGLAGPTRGQAEGPLWRRTSKGMYVPAAVDPDVPEQRILEQSLRLPPGGAVTAWAALRLHGAAFFDGLEPNGRTRMRVPLAAGRGAGIRSDGAVLVSREPLEATEIVLRQGIPVMVPLRALFDEMRRPEDWREAVVDMDMAAAAGLVSISQMRDYLAEHRGWRRSSQVERALGFASERSLSPNEVRMRMVWEIDAGLPRPLVNQEIFTLDGRFVARVDMLDETAGVVGEFDGGAHLRTRRRSRDIGREEALRRLGLEYFDAVRPDLDDRAGLAERMRSTRDRAKFLPPDQRRWTVVPPEGWVREPSLDERLFLLEMAQQMAEDLGA